MNFVLLEISSILVLFNVIDSTNMTVARRGEVVGMLTPLNTESEVLSSEKYGNFIKVLFWENGK